jgi:indolepyruvate ferredoxin oxidoreductase
VTAVEHSAWTYDPADRFVPSAAPVLLGGVPAIARLFVEQLERDRAAGLHTAVFASGYPGSPLGGLDLALASARELRDRPEFALVPGVNEELAATAVWGSQMVLRGRTPRFDGTVGTWYGKAPGVDRAGDAFRTGNLFGAHPRGGVLVLAGDDPGAKSSTIPSASEPTLASFGIPVLVPRSSEEVVRLGLLGVALSRASGCWTALKIVADVADGAWSVARDFGALEISVPELEWDGRPWTYRQQAEPGPPAAAVAEQELVGPRWEMVRAFARANRLDEVAIEAPDAWLGIVAAGKTSDDVRQALLDLGLDAETAARRGIRLLRVAMVNPLELETVRAFARGLETVLVVEEKQPFLEAQVREALYGAGAPALLGKRDLEGRPLVPAHGELTAPRLADALRRVLAPRVELRPAAAPAAFSLPALPVRRTAYFCSGCPHNRSTVVPEGSLAGAGIGCHGLVGMMERPTSAVTGLTQMGGEGAQWIGQSYIHEREHLFQNVGDGTFFHSGQLAVQACVAAGVDITFKLLYNAAVAMTGGQDAAGARPVADVTRKLEAEGVVRTIVCAEEPERYRGLRGTLAGNAEVWSRDRLEEAQLLLREIPGVTVLIYDQQCANQARRLRKRGLLPARTTRVLINQDVCEGCGDCSRKSNCLSVQPVETALGTKRRIDQTSCNTDYSCMDGDCPSFVTVEEGPAERRPAPTPPPAPDPPTADAAGTTNVFLAGIGGTGVVTVNQVLATAALLDGLEVRTLDQTGMSQKAGQVVSHLRFGPDAEPSNRVGAGQADCYLALDPLTGSDAQPLSYASPERTAAFASTSAVPTGAMVDGYSGATLPPAEQLLGRIRSSVRDLVDLDTFAASSALFGSTTPAHFLLVGVAVQAGALPLSPAAVERALELNRTGVADNVAAFRWGRAALADPAAFAAATMPAPSQPPTHPLPESPLGGPTREAAAVRAAQLEAYGGEKLVRRYLDGVEAAWRAERAVGPRTDFSRAVAVGLHKVLAVKDEYEVARLLTAPSFDAWVAGQVPGAHRLRYRLHPPLLRALGLRRKIALGPAWRPFLVLLARLRFLRDTLFDPFGHTRLRRTERRLAREYAELTTRLAASLDAESYERATSAAEAVELVRGYESVKLAGIDRFHERLRELGL